jgi:hypothetical protein
MALQTSGQISLNDLHVEAGGSSGSECSFNDTDIRDMIDKSSGSQSSMSEFYGATSGNEVEGAHLFVQDPTDSNENQHLGSSSYTFTVPTGVLNISVVCIGQGAFSNTNPNTYRKYYYQSNGGGFGGGGLAYKNNIDVVAGQTFSVTLNDSYARFYRAGVCDVRGNAASLRSGGTYSGGDGGGNGGNGGFNNAGSNNDVTFYVGSGGGGAGGYGGSGGAGGSAYAPPNATQNGANGSNGGGGGGGNVIDLNQGSGYGGGMTGGGTAPFGQGSNGSGGSGDTNTGSGFNATRGGGGSGNTTNFPSTSESNGNLVFFGGGYWGGYVDLNGGGSYASRNTRRGCVRVVWGLGSGQAFPSTDVAYRDGESTN